MITLQQIQKRLDNILGSTINLSSYYYYKDYSKTLLKRFEHEAFYLDLFQRCKSMKAISTDQIIQYSEDLPFGNGPEQIHNEHRSKNSYRSENDDLNVYLRRNLIGGLRSRVILSFYKKSLFYFGYNFSSLSERNKEKIIKTIEDKYLNGSTFSTEEFSIRDSSGNHLIIEDGVNLKIHYIAFRLDIFNEFMEKENELVRDAKKREEENQKELFRKL